ncbi:glycosyltransferase [Sinosporangium siamense]|uniref:Glycosyltransferase 2-like domain-containing protein n=1 Tax=Sinosporangium siamense TaxID=1367973 RepID=A0A919RC70_9ACTN|nr:glycosyltransferase [Sinosporangium siamense]GII91251.1 hypothetical protein Ssi02_14820 [Sinosporangium siamense]
MTGGASRIAAPDSSPPGRPQAPPGPGTRRAGQPLIRHNDYSPISPPPLSGWTPSLSVSVVVPAHCNQEALDLTLAALAAQTYPAHLMEVVVVDDGSAPPLRLPGIAPEHTRLVRLGREARDGEWGIAHAVNMGVRAAEGELIQRLDADMVTCREHIKALARWHHKAHHLVTIGIKRFTDDVSHSPGDVHDKVAMGAFEALFPAESTVPSSTSATIARTDGLRTSRNPYHVCTGPTLSLRKETFQAVGGLDTQVLRGEDTEFAYRLAMHGVVFIPDMAADAVHLGLPSQRREPGRAVRAVEPFLAHRVPLRRDLRKEPGRHWLVPYIEIVFEVGGVAQEVVREGVGAALSGSLQDVVVTLIAPWSALPAGRRPVLEDPSFDLRALREHYSHDERVRLRDEVAVSPSPVPYRYVGPVDVPLGRRTLEKMVETVQRERPGVLVIDLPGGRTATLERTDALNRARLLAAPGDDLREIVDATHGIRRSQASDYWPAPRRPVPAAAESAAPERDAAKPAPSGAAQPPAGKREAPPESWLAKMRDALQRR